MTKELMAMMKPPDRLLPVFTVDLDWAPDFMLDWLAQEFIRWGIKSTWFITHDTPSLARLRQHPDLFELGLHPNFAGGSSHGDSPQAILDHCRAIVPEARVVRTHSLFSSSPLLDLQARNGIACDASLLLPGIRLDRPLRYDFGDRQILRLPLAWLDDLELNRPSPRFLPNQIAELPAGLAILAFHPVHVYLNARSLAAYRSIKSMVPKLTDLTEGQAVRHRNTGEDGMFTLLQRFVAMVPTPAHSYCLKDLYDGSYT